MHFRSSGEDLGEEGSIPPTLDRVGNKLTRQALRKTIEGRFNVRPYMNTRMPHWGAEHANKLSILLAEQDRNPNEAPTPSEGRENQVGRNMWGRALIGVDGLGCIQCHRLNQHPSLGIQAMDLMHAPERLRASWFRDYLLDPSGFRPGTRMPAFWPDGKPSLGGHGGTAERQIDSLWVYLKELDQSRLPAGMERNTDFELKPHSKPIVFRTFMEDAGLHAVAVGFPEGYHAALDTDSCRWVLAWKGAFLSAESTWDDRFTPLAKTMGAPKAWFPPQKDHWNTHPTQRRFSGYRLDPNGVPTFYYQVGPVSVEDRLSATQQGFLRTLQWTKGDASTALLVRTWPGSETGESNHIPIDAVPSIEIQQGTPQRLRHQDTEQMWILPQIKTDQRRIITYTMEEATP